MNKVTIPPEKSDIDYNINKIKEFSYSVDVVDKKTLKKKAKPKVKANKVKSEGSLLLDLRTIEFPSPSDLRTSGEFFIMSSRKRIEGESNVSLDSIPQSEYKLMTSLVFKQYLREDLGLIEEKDFSLPHYDGFDFNRRLSVDVIVGSFKLTKKGLEKLIKIGQII